MMDIVKKEMRGTRTIEDSPQQAAGNATCYACSIGAAFVYIDLERTL
jgi:hypothetical protein